MIKKSLVLAVAILVPAAIANATLTIDVGTHDLMENMAGQEITISVSGGDQVSGFKAQVQIDNNVAASPVKITGLGLGLASDGQADLLFAANNNGGGFKTVMQGYALNQTLTQSGTIAAEGALVRVTLDTTGVMVGEGPFALKLKGTAGGDSVFTFATGGQVPVEIVNGMINIVPEPASALLLLAGLPFLRRRR